MELFAKQHDYHIIPLQSRHSYYQLTLAVLTAFSILVVQREGQKVAQMAVYWGAQTAVRLEARMVGPMADHLAD